MKYTNPVIPGFYPDPSICKANGKYYMVCSSFHYFPGVPLFESEDLVNWEQIGHVLTRDSQLPLDSQGISGGIYAPTIRYNDGRFYMVTTNVGGMGNFYVWTDDIHGEWSEPILVEQGGIDPSLYFEDGKTYFMSNGADDEGVWGISQCEIDIETGKKLTPCKCIYHGAGGRFIESPHLYKFGNEYYIMVAEGGTEYGHMVVYGKGPTPYGPFENYPENPVLTNRNLGGYMIQGCGHADLVEDDNGNVWMVHLAFRQIDKWMPYHITGREVYLVPVTFGEDGWFRAGVNGTTPVEIETDRIPDSVVQKRKLVETFANTTLEKDWVYMRNPQKEWYDFTEERLLIKPSPLTIEELVKSPAFLAIRQREMEGTVQVRVKMTEGEAGLSMYMNEEQHYDLCIRKKDGKYQVVKRSAIGWVSCEQNVVEIGESGEALLEIGLTNCDYYFSCVARNAVGEEVKYDLGKLQTRYLSSEVAGGFTGVMIALYAQCDVETEAAEFREFKVEYK